MAKVTCFYPKNEKKVLEIEGGEVLLEAFEKEGEILPRGCLSGVCGACKIFVLEGEEGPSPPGELEKDTLETLKREKPEFRNKNLRLACRVKVLGEFTFKPIGKVKDRDER